MYLSLKTKKTPVEHKILLLLSTLVVASSLLAFVHGYKHITLSYVPQPKVEERVIALKINPAPIKKEIVKKEILKQEIVKEVVQEKIIKKPKKIPKPIKKEVVKEEVIVKQEIVKEVVLEKQEIVQAETVTKEELMQEVVQETTPVFDEKAKESFIAGLYEILNENKHYPKMAQRRKLEGVCHVSFTLSKDGKLKDVFLKEACGHSILDTAALKVVRSVEFYKAIPDSVSLTSLHLNIPIKYARN